MIAHTWAFDALRKQSQEFLNYVVLTCTAVPQLRQKLATGTISAATMATPDYFRGVKISQVAELIPSYKEQLARSAIVTLFSFFEAYMHGLLNEIVAFHGGRKIMIEMADRRTRKYLDSPAPEIIKAKRKLQEPAKRSKMQKYIKYSQVLANAGYRFPSELMASLGVRVLAKKAEPNGFKAWEIIDILENALHFALTDAERKRIIEIRKLRNTIAHGEGGKIELKNAMKVSTDLHNLSARIDRHAIEHFFVLEKFV